MFNGFDNIRTTLTTKKQSAGFAGEAGLRRRTNILAIKGLGRVGLKYGVKEMLLLVKETQAGERLFIRYPGKESELSDEKNRPWDFRPKVQLSDGTFSEDLSFWDIWKTLFEELKATEGFEELTPTSVFLATLFYRMAFMYDHNKTTNVTLSSLVDEYDPQADTWTQSTGKPVNVKELYLYNPPKEAIDYISRHGTFAGLSVEALLH